MVRCSSVTTLWRCSLIAPRIVESFGSESVQRACSDRLLVNRLSGNHCRGPSLRPLRLDPPRPSPAQKRRLPRQRRLFRAGGSPRIDSRGCAKGLRAWLLVGKSRQRCRLPGNHCHHSLFARAKTNAHERSRNVSRRYTKVSLSATFRQPPHRQMSGSSLVTESHPLMLPEAAWGRIKVGGRTPPVRVREGCSPSSTALMESNIRAAPR
jgi:hypothetical protein